MLVLGRKLDESLVFITPEGRRILVVVTNIKGGNQVRLGIKADREVKILRGELESREKETA